MQEVVLNSAVGQEIVYHINWYIHSVSYIRFVNVHLLGSGHTTAEVTGRATVRVMVAKRGGPVTLYNDLAVYC